MATKSKRRAPAKKRTTTTRRPVKRRSSADENAWYMIKYCYPEAPNPITEEFDLPPAAPRRLDPRARTQVATMRCKVRGRSAMQAQRAALRSAGATIVSVQRLGWFGALFG